jgi:aminotransferase
MVVTARATDGSRFVAERARVWLTDDAPAAITPALPVIDLARGELDLPAAPHIIAAVADALDRGETHYTSRPGIAPLRHALAAQLAAETGIAYDPQTEMLISSGGQEGLFVAVQMLIRPGDEVLLADPGYPTYADAVRLAGGTCVPVPVDPLAGTGMTADAIAARLTPRTRLLVLVSPDNPTGAVIDRAAMAKIAALAVEHDFLVLFDEIYKLLLFDGAAHVNIAAFPGMRSRTVTVGSFSKGYAMTGWRVGYVAGEAHLIQPITDLKLALSICSAAPSQWAALAALTGPQDAVAAMLDDLHERRTTLLPKLTALGLPHGNPRGAYYAFADIRSTGLSSAQCAQVFHERAGVRTLPGHLFGPGGEGYLRFSLASPAPLIRDAMSRLAPIVGELKTIEPQRRRERRGHRGEKGEKEF